MAAEDALDQYFARHPDELLGGRSRRSYATRKTPVCSRFICFALRRSGPLVEGDAEHFGEPGVALAAALQDLVRTHEGLAYRGLRSSQRKRFAAHHGSAWPWSRRSPARVRADGRKPRHSSAHPGAIHLHQGEQYLVTDLDLDHGVALVRPFNGAYYTQAKRVSSIGIMAERTSETRMGMRVVHGDIEMREQVVGYQRKRLSDHTAIDLIELKCPSSSTPPRRSGSSRKSTPRTTCWGHCMPPSTL